MAASAASQPLFPDLAPARCTACSSVSAASTPKVPSITTGTAIPQRVCEPVFLMEARSRATREFVQEFTGLADLDDLSEEVQQETDEMNAVYADLIQRYPAFAEALLILEDLKARLEELGG